MDEKVRQRALRRFLRITLPDGKVLCYKSATMTFVEALQKIEADKLKEVKLESYHLPLISQEVYPRFKDWMKPSVMDGINVQSDSDQKYMQLVSIAQQLGLDWKIEVGSDFTPSDDKVPQCKIKTLIIISATMHLNLDVAQWANQSQEGTLEFG